MYVATDATPSTLWRRFPETLLNALYVVVIHQREQSTFMLCARKTFMFFETRRGERGVLLLDQRCCVAQSNKYCAFLNMYVSFAFAIFTIILACSNNNAR